MPNAAPKRRPHHGIALALAVLTTISVAACSSGDGDPATSTSPKATTSTTRATADPATLTKDRPYDVHVPPSYEQGTPAPLLVLLHGYGTTGDIQSAYLNLTPSVDARGMLYVHPDGTTNATGKQFWAATDACCAGPKPKVDDSAYLAAVIEEVQATYDVDPKRIFVMGHSNGGFMSYRMACDHADVVAAVVSLEGATYEDPSKCNPSEPVATLQVHGTADKTIRYDGGKIVGTPYPGAEDTVQAWAEANGCRTTPDTGTAPRRDIVQDLPAATVTTYSKGCDEGGHAELWTQPDGVHIPRWSATFPDQALDFLLAHPKP